MRFDFTTILSAQDAVQLTPTGSFIFKIGDPAEVMYVVKSGQA